MDEGLDDIDMSGASTSGDSAEPQKKSKRERFIWSTELHSQFEQTIQELGAWQDGLNAAGPGLEPHRLSHHLSLFRLMVWHFL